MKENSPALATALREIKATLENAPRRMSPQGAVLKCLLPVSAVATLELAADALEPPTRAVEGYFDQIVAAAVAGQRCPQNDLIPSAAFSRLAREGRVRAEVSAAMRAVNPAVIPRNHRVEEALSAAQERDDLVPLHELLAALASPFEPGASAAKYREPPADECGYRTFCGT